MSNPCTFPTCLSKYSSAGDLQFIIGLFIENILYDMIFTVEAIIQQKVQRYEFIV